MRYLLHLSLVLCTLTGPAAVLAAPVVAGSSLEDRLARVERRVSRLTDLMMQVDSLKQENRQLRGELEEQQHRMESMRRKQRDLYLDMDQRLGRFQQPPASVPGSISPSATPSLTPVPEDDDQQPQSAPQQTAGTGLPVGTNQPAGGGVAPAAEVVDLAKERADYQAAYDLLRPENRRYQDAIIALREFLAQYPESQFSPNAQYWLAEASYVSQDNASALIEFKKVVDQYPDHSKTPGALLKIGYIQHAEGLLKEARESLNRVIRTYPTSSAAGMAQQRIARIAGESN